MGYKPITPQQFEAGRTAGLKRLARSLTADAVHYNAHEDVVFIQLSDKMMVGVKRSAVSEWAGLSPEELNGVRLSAVHDAISVGSHDVQVSIEGLLMDLMPEMLVRRAFAQRGGASTSHAKANAARSNGALGGRPKKVAAR